MAQRSFPTEKKSHKNHNKNLTKYCSLTLRVFFYRKGHADFFFGHTDTTDIHRFFNEHKLNELNEDENYYSFIPLFLRDI